MWTSFDFQSGKIQKANCRHDPISNVFDGKETGISISHAHVTAHERGETHRHEHGRMMGDERRDHIEVCS